MNKLDQILIVCFMAIGLIIFVTMASKPYDLAHPRVFVKSVGSGSPLESK